MYFSSLLSFPNELMGSLGKSFRNTKTGMPMFADCGMERNSKVSPTHIAMNECVWFCSPWNEVSRINLRWNMSSLLHTWHFTLLARKVFNGWASLFNYDKKITEFLPKWREDMSSFKAAWNFFINFRGRTTRQISRRGTKTFCMGATMK